MRADSVLMAGICFLAVVAPHPSAAQSPTAKAAVRVIKQAPRWVYEAGEGWKIDPPYEFYNKWVGLKVAKLPSAGRLWKGIAGTTGTVGTTLGTIWECDHAEWCRKQK